MSFSAIYESIFHQCVIKMKWIQQKTLDTWTSGHIEFIYPHFFSVDRLSDLTRENNIPNK